MIASSGWRIAMTPMRQRTGRSLFSQRMADDPVTPQARRG